MLNATLSHSHRGIAPAHGIHLIALSHSGDQRMETPVIKHSIALSTVKNIQPKSYCEHTSGRLVDLNLDDDLAQLATVSNVLLHTITITEAPVAKATYSSLFPPSWKRTCSSESSRRFHDCGRSIESLDSAAGILNRDFTPPGSCVRRKGALESTTQVSLVPQRVASYPSSLRVDLERFLSWV